MRYSLTFLALAGAATAQQVMKLVTDATFDTSVPEPNLYYPGDHSCRVWENDNY